jgi:hypothetical protein
MNIPTPTPVIKIKISKMEKPLGQEAIILNIIFFLGFIDISYLSEQNNVNWIFTEIFHYKIFSNESTLITVKNP